MTAKGLRIAEIDARTPPQSAARAILRDRLGCVEGLIKRCRKTLPLTSAMVHELRASTRKAVVALDSFACLLDPKARRKLHKRLGRIRRAAGGVRDTDVALDILRDVSPQAESLPGLDHAIAQTEAQREAGSRTLRDAVERDAGRKLRKLRRRLLCGLPCTPESGPASLRELAETALTGAISRSRAATTADLALIHNLHSLRIALRKLRLTLELFEMCVPVTFDLTSSVRDLVTLLGRVNDLSRVAAICDEISSSAPHNTASAAVASLAARFGLIRDRRHAHALQSVARLDALLLTPLEDAVRATRPVPAAGSVDTGAGAPGAARSASA